MDQKTEIRSYIKCRIRLNIDSKQIFNELCRIYGPQTISMRTLFRWVKALKLGNVLLKMIPVLEGLKPVTKANRCCKDCGRTGCTIVCQIYS